VLGLIWLKKEPRKQEVITAKGCKKENPLTEQGRAKAQKWRWSGKRRSKSDDFGRGRLENQEALNVKMAWMRSETGLT